MTRSASASPSAAALRTSSRSLPLRPRPQPPAALFAVLVAMAAAAPALAEGTVVTGPGLVGPRDSADRSCRVVLRSVAHTDTPCTSGVACGAFEGDVDVDDALLDAGLQPAVLARRAQDDRYAEIAATPVSSAIPGFTRFHFSMVDDEVSPSRSARPRLQVIPFLHLLQGGRLFDHNRGNDDLDVYVLDEDKSPRIDDDKTVCRVPGASITTTLTFGRTGGPSVRGALLPGQDFVVRYPIERLTACRATHNGYPAWDLRANVRFLPQGDTASASVRGFDSPNGIPQGQAYATPAHFTVPDGATAMEVWFANEGIDCADYDSRGGLDYRIEMSSAPRWVGSPEAALTRASGAPCDDAAPYTGDLRFSTWARTRAVRTHFCFDVYAPGITDVANVDLGDVARKLVAQARVRYDGNRAFVVAPADAVGRFGNNVRFSVDLRPLDPFPPYACHIVPTALHELPGSSLVYSTMELLPVVNGVELRPANDEVFRVDYEDDDTQAFRRSACGATNQPNQ